MSYHPFPRALHTILPSCCPFSYPLTSYCSTFYRSFCIEPRHSYTVPLSLSSASVHAYFITLPSFCPCLHPPCFSGSSILHLCFHFWPKHFFTFLLSLRFYTVFLSFIKFSIPFFILFLSPSSCPLSTPALSLCCPVSQLCSCLSYTLLPSLISFLPPSVSFTFHRLPVFPALSCSALTPRLPRPFPPLLTCPHRLLTGIMNITTWQAWPLLLLLLLCYFPSRTRALNPANSGDPRRGEALKLLPRATPAYKVSPTSVLFLA